MALQKKGDCFVSIIWTYSWGRVGLRKGSFSAPFIALVLRCFGSEFAVRAWELLEDGGFLLASSFLCLSMSSLCWFIHSCCLRKKSRKSWESRVATHIKTSWRDKNNLFLYFIMYFISHYFTRFWKAYPSVHCSVNEAPCLTVVKWPKRSLSCMLFSRHACFSWVLCRTAQNESACRTAAPWSFQRVSDNFTFSMSNFLLMVMHLFKRSLYFSSNFCCSSICLLRSQFACKTERTVSLIAILMHKPRSEHVRIFHESIANSGKFLLECTAKVLYYLGWLNIFQYPAGMPFLVRTHNNRACLQMLSNCW